ncbi:MAG: response regulator, partial [Xenococcaceae cyanobacterium]
QKNSSKSNFDLKGVRVLLVDDTPEHVEFLLFALEQQGVRCMIVSSAKDALSAIETFKPNVLVSDIAMPDIDGYQFLRLLRSLPGDRGGQIPAIALSAYARDEDRIKALAAGFHQHISKPIEPYLLVAAIAEVLQNKHN